jgi:MFS family permease
MLHAILSSWALLLGFGLLMLGDGLQGTLLGLRASLEGFPTTVTGLVLSAYFVGFLGGSLLAPRLVQRVGHVRAFAALASVASTAILIHAIFVEPAAWGVLRLATGFCFAGLYVVTESWLNDRATNENRGQLLSVYMLVMYGGVGAGQFLLNAADPKGFVLFILVSVLISIALVPLLLSAGPAPDFENPDTLGLGRLYRISPLGVVGAFGTGWANSAFFAMAPVAAETLGYSVAEVSIFMSAAVAGCILLQWPIGHASDRFDRRTVLMIVTALAAVAAALAVPLTDGPRVVFFIAVAVFGGLSFPMYSLCIAHANDYLESAQMVPASGALVLVGGVGAILGPFSASATMSHLGPQGLFWCLAAVHAAIGVFALYRMARRPSRPLDAQRTYTPVALRIFHIFTRSAERSGEKKRGPEGPRT